MTRLADVVTADADEQVQSVALQQLAPVISAWPAAAKIWVFSEVPQLLLERVVTVQDNDAGAWTNGNAVTADALRCITACLSHEAAAVHLVTQSDPHWWPHVARLLDLRQGQYYLHPETLAKNKQQQYSNKSAADTTDDLDDLLAAGDKKGTAQPANDNDATPKPPVPYLMPAEEDVLKLVLELLRTCFQHDQVRLQVWKSERPIVALCWDWACMGPPPANGNFPCAFSSIDLQAQVLDLVALYLNNGTLLLDPSWHGLDRLLYLVCTGGPGTTQTEQVQVSQAAVAVLRACLRDQPAIAQECLLAALAPPPEGEVSEAERMQAAAMPRLLQTVVEQLQSTNDASSSCVGLIGALSALNLFAGTTEGQKSLLLKFATNSLLHDAWERLAVECEQLWPDEDSKRNRQSSGTSEEAVAKRVRSQTAVLSILRWVGAWMTDAPLVVQAFLQDASSAQIMGQLVQVPKEANADQAGKLIATCASLVLGIALVNLPKDDCGGWTSDTIVAVLGKLPARMAQWEDLKKKSTASSNQELLPWTVNTVEAKAWQAWVSTQVLGVRKALIHFVAGSGSNGGDDDDDDDDDAPPQDGGPSRKSLQAMLAQQAQEMERLQTELQASQLKVQAQGKSPRSGGVLK